MVVKKAFYRCPEFETFYIIQPDDELLDMNLICIGSTESIIFIKSEKFSEGELLPYYKTEVINGSKDCIVEIIILDKNGGSIGYTLK